MHLVDDIKFWVDLVLYWGMVALRVWAVGDCLTRKAAAFPAVDKLTKPIWLAILIIGGAIGSLPTFSVINILSLVSLVAALVYLTDVRPAVREVSGGSR
jgi:hypothetical protein